MRGLWVHRTDPGLEELLIALAAGIAGAYVEVRHEETGLLPGVAIGVSLVPPLAAVGILLYFDQGALAWEAFLLFVTNLAAIVLAACAVFIVLGMRPRILDAALTLRISLGSFVSLIIVVALAIELEHFRDRLNHFCFSGCYR